MVYVDLVLTKAVTLTPYYGLKVVARPSRTTRTSHNKISLQFISHWHIFSQDVTANWTLWTQWQWKQRQSNCWTLWIGTKPHLLPMHASIERTLPTPYILLSWTPGPLCLLSFMHLTVWLPYLLMSQLCFWYHVCFQWWLVPQYQCNILMRTGVNISLNQC